MPPLSTTGEDTVVLNISEMIDLAIGSPEVGTVDFNMLQTVLHCLAQQQRVLDKNVEVHGLGMAFPSRESPNAQTIAVQEFAIGTDGKPPVQKPREVTPEETILVVERIKKSDAPTQVEAHATGAPRQPRLGKHGEQAGVLGEKDATGQAGAAGTPGAAGVSALEGLSLVTYSKFNLLENTVQDLQKRVYGSIPKNEEILEEVRSQTNIKAIQDMWQNLNVSARLQAAENGIGKLSSLVQDIINETSGLKDLAQSAIGEIQKVHESARAEKSSAVMSPRSSHAPFTAASSEHGPGFISSPIESGYPLGPSASKAELRGVEEFVKRLREDLDYLTEIFYKAMQQIPSLVDLPPPPEMRPRLEEILAPKASANGGVGTPGGGPASGSDRSGGGRRPKSSRRPGGGAGGGGGGGGAAAVGSSETIDSDVINLMERMNDVEKGLEECQKALNKREGGIQDQITSFQDQLEYMSKQIGGLTTNINTGALSPDLVKDLQGLMQLFQTVQEMQEQLAQVHDTALQLAAEKEDRKYNVNVLLEQIELLKTMKLDREDMAEAMAEKADLRMLAKKVSHNQFELACDDLSRGLETALGKLNMQEALWQQALDDIQREIETKLDKMELSPVKEFFNSKLKMLQESLKQMASLRREAEAAGTKKRLLRDVNCLSCDANAVMQMEAPPALPVPKPFPGTLSMKPYLSYELDTIRKTQASNLPQRNMHDWENIDKQMSQQPKQQKVRSGADKHLCNRYCGGSHTTTTPAQRVARLGHFIKQWGPDVLPLSSGLAAGDDGRMYRINPSEGASVGPGAIDTTCTPKSPKKPELPSGLSEGVVAEDCKCIEPPPLTGKGK